MSWTCHIKRTICFLLNVCRFGLCLEASMKGAEMDSTAAQASAWSWFSLASGEGPQLRLLLVASHGRSPSSQLYFLHPQGLRPGPGAGDSPGGCGGK